MSQVIIERANDGCQYEIPRAAFSKKNLFCAENGDLTSFEDAGFKIIASADGSPINQPNPTASHTVTATPKTASKLVTAKKPAVLAERKEPASPVSKPAEPRTL